MLEKETDQLINQMTSFYQEHLPTDSAYAKLLDAYIQTFLAIWEEVKYLRKHVALETSPTLYTVKYAKVDIGEALYSKREALRIQRLSTLEEKLSELNKMNKFSSFVFNEMGTRNPVVYDLTLKESFSADKDLLLYQDYFIRNNRLYILPEYIIGNDRHPETLHAFDIRVDNFMLEKKWGVFFDIETGPMVPRYKYRDILSAYQQLLSGNLSIKELKSAIRLATDWETFDVLDLFSPNLRPRIKNLYDTWLISPSHFVVALPEELIAKKIELNVLLSMLDEAKEEHLNYLVLFEILRLETIKEHLSDPDRHDLSLKEKDIFIPQETTLAKRQSQAEDYLFPRNRYDTGRLYDVAMTYDHNLIYHTLDNTEVPLTTDTGDIFDAPWKHLPEYAEVKHINFPEIPRLFTVTKMVDGKLEVKVRSNTDGTEFFELLASPEEYGTYEPLAVFSNDDTAAENILIYDANASVNRYYKIRAIAGLYVSLATLPIDTVSL